MKYGRGFALSYRLNRAIGEDLQNRIDWFSKEFFGCLELAHHGEIFLRNMDLGALVTIVLTGGQQREFGQSFGRL